MKTLSSGNCTLSVPAKNSYRMVVLGASRVGKSSIVSRFLNGRFEDQYTPTIEDFHRKVYNIRGDMYQLDILDTSGNHPFPAMRRLSILTGRSWVGMGAEYVGVCAPHFTVCRALAYALSEMKPAAPSHHDGQRGIAAHLSKWWHPNSILPDSESITHDSRCCLPDQELIQTCSGEIPGNGGAATFLLQEVTQRNSEAHGQSAGLRSPDTIGLCHLSDW